jgi:PTS system mannose-specific IID component
MASVAVGALARAELDGESDERITRFRTALCGPLGSLGDRLIWAGLLPVCSLMALGLFGLGVRPLIILVAFLVVYNTAHVALRVWGLEAGWRHGLRVSHILGPGVLRSAGVQIARAGALLTGLALPIAIHRLAGGDAVGARGMAYLLAAVAVGAFLLVKLQGRIHGWRAALVLLVAYVLFAMVI